MKIALELTTWRALGERVIEIEVTDEELIRIVGAVNRALRERFFARGQRSHCRNGHEYSEENIYVNKIGGRKCVTCIENRKQKKATT